MSVNWKWPGEISVALPITGQWFKGCVGFAVASTLKREPGVLVKENSKNPLASILVLLNVIAGAAEAITLIMLLRLGMPLTNTVAKAQPGGKRVTGPDVKVLAEQLLDVSMMVQPLSMLRS